MTPEDNKVLDDMVELQLQREKPIGNPMPRNFRHEVLHKGGSWLGDVREWMQCKIPNGEHVTWGSNDLLGSLTVPTQPACFTVKDVEEIGAVAATAVYNEIGCGPDEVQRLRHKVKIATAMLERVKTHLEVTKDADRSDSIYGSVIWDIGRLNRE